MTNTDQEASEEQMMQQTLTGNTTTEEFQRPKTQIHCRTCGEWIIRSQRSEHDADGHLLVDPDDFDGGDGEEDDDPRIVGGMYTVRVDYNVTFQRRVAAADEHQAREIAKDLISISEDTPNDAIHLHNDVHKTEDLDENDERMEDVPGWPW